MSKDVVISIVSAPETMPAYQTTGAAGADLHAVEDYYIAPGAVQMVRTGVKVAIPEGYVGLVFPRSSTASKRRLSLANNVGVIDSDYRGEILLAIENRGTETQAVPKGERVAQLIIMPFVQATFKPVSEHEFELYATDRGEGGFGSTGA